MRSNDHSANSSSPNGKEGRFRSVRATFLPADAQDDVVWNEFAAVKVEIVRTGLTPRLKLTDLDSGEWILIDPLELASFISTPDEVRASWLAVGPYSL